MSNIMEEVEKLLQKGAIEFVPKGQEGRGFYSIFFTVPKKDGGIRPILNLKPLNVFLQKEHFKMETLWSIIQAMQPGDWAVSIDLKDAYLHIPVHVKHRKYLRFCIHNRHYQFRAMPFGLAIAPRIFTKVMAAVGGHLRCQQIHIFMSLDDWLIRNVKRFTANAAIQTNQPSCRLGTPDQCRKITVHSFPDNNLSGGSIQLARRSSISIGEQIYSNSTNNSRNCSQTAVLFLRILGLMASCIDIVPLARLHMRPIQ